MLNFSKWLRLRETVGLVDFPSKATPKDLEVPPVGDTHRYGVTTPFDSRNSALEDQPNVGTEGNPLGRIDQWIDNLVDTWKNFKPTADQPCPGCGGGMQNPGDLGAALAGKKVAWYGSGVSSLSKLIAQRVKQRIGNEDPKFARGITWMEPFKSNNSLAMQQAMLVGPEDKVRKLARLLKRQFQLMDAGEDLPWALEREIGELLGYPPEAIHKYLHEIIPYAHKHKRGELRMGGWHDTADDAHQFRREVERTAKDKWGA
jgi:hypothetical protein